MLIQIQKASLKTGLQNVIPPSGKTLNGVMVVSYLMDQPRVLAPPTAPATPAKCEGKLSTLCFLLLVNFTLGWPASVSPSEVVRSCQHGLAEVLPLDTVVMGVLLRLSVSQFSQLILCSLTFLSFGAASLTTRKENYTEMPRAQGLYRNRHSPLSND